MRVSVALALVVVLALPQARAAAPPGVAEANTRLVTAMRASDRDEAALESALVAALANGAKLQGPGAETTQRELKQLLGALRTFRSEKAGIVVRTEQGARDAEAAKRAMAFQPYGGVLSVLQGVIIAAIASIMAVWTGGKNPVVPDLSGSLVPVLKAVESLTTTVHRSLSEFSRTAPTSDLSAVTSAMATVSRTNAAARQAQASLQAPARIPAAAAPKPLANPLLPSSSPKTPPR